jgi:acyl-coenzyme A thioesterase PaaI-like protein
MRDMLDPMEILPQTMACFGCGHGNPAGVSLKMKTDGKAVYADWSPRQEHAGFSHAVHGGVIATVIDEMMAWACGILGGKFAYSVDMNIRYHKVIEPGMQIRCVGNLDENRRGKLFLASAKLLINDVTAASGSAKFFPLRGDQESMLQSEFGNQWEGIQTAMTKYGSSHQV